MNQYFQYIFIILLKHCVLACEILDLIIELLKGKGQITKQAFETLITSQLSNLDLSFREKKETLHLLNLASMKCIVIRTIKFYFLYIFNK
jgi:hypothetical protein